MITARGGFCLQPRAADGLPAKCTPFDRSIRSTADNMTIVLWALLAVAIMLFAGFLSGFFHLHSTLGKHHLRGRKTWAEELEQLPELHAD